jgi:hypothetical protein
MTGSARRWSMGRRLCGAAAVAFGVAALVWRDAAGAPFFAYAAAAAQIAGGTALQFQRSAKAGALVLTVVYLAFAASSVPGIFAAPLVYISWGNVFEQVALATGPLLVYARSSPAGRVLLGVCTVSFALEQALYLSATAALVPAWLPPGPTFWAEATTVFFALAAAALLTDRLSLLATRLLTAMLVVFGVVVWLPVLFSDPHSHANWSETIETFAIAGTAWILADLLGEDASR